MQQNQQHYKLNGKKGYRSENKDDWEHGFGKDKEKQVQG